MPFFLVKPSTDPEKIGRVYPQVEGIYPISVDHPDFISNAVPDYIKIDKPVIVPMAKIKKKSAKLTDLIRCSNIGFNSRLLISDKLKVILEQSNCLGSQFLATQVFGFNNEAYEYWLVNTHIFFSEYIDYSKSELWLIGSAGTKMERVYCDSYEDFESKCKVHAPVPIKVEKVVLNETLVEYDFFTINNTTEGVLVYFVSENLKIKIEAAECTGIDFEPVLASSEVEE